MNDTPEPTPEPTSEPTPELTPELSRGLDLETDPALAAAVLEIEAHVAGEGWDGPARLFALVDTAALVRAEPTLAMMMGLDAPDQDGSLTPIEQDQVPVTTQLEDVLQTTAWPEGVSGCAAVVERLVLPPDADGKIPADAEEAAEFAKAHPDRQEVRIVAGATRAGATYCALRLRAHDDDQSVIGGVDLVPELLELLRVTLEETPADEPLDSEGDE